jgi:leucine dehydrogenase
MPILWQHTNKLEILNMELKDHSNDLSTRHHEDILSMSNQINLPNPSFDIDDVFQYASNLKYGELHFKMDAKTGLFAIIAIHSTKLGPAIGGSRCISYPTTSAAIIDAIRLAHMMSYKAAICGLNHGGAKAVLMKPEVIKDRQAYFESFGEFVHQLNGRYVAAMDSGTDLADMDNIAHKTPYVTCTTANGGGGDPSPYTALGVRRGIEAAVKFKLGRDTLEGVHVAIQGVGHVGYYLAKELHQLGARLTVTDINSQHSQRCQQEFGAKVVPNEDIYHIECDVFAPCALGAILNSVTIEQLNTPIVAGAANNQLRDLTIDDQRLFERGILYAPDFLINAGGLIEAASAYDNGNLSSAVTQIHSLYEATLNIFERAKSENKPTNYIAQVIAQERLS